MTTKHIDMHLHTNCSDGTYSVEEIFRKAKKENISAISITDHDTIAAIPSALNFSKKYDVEFIPGIEFSCIYKNYNLHILGYFFDIKNKEFLNEINYILKSREERNSLIIQKLRNYNIIINEQKLKNSMNGTVTRANIAKQMVEEGYVFSVKDAFSKYLDYDRPCYVKREKISAEYIINLIHMAGGIAFIAHVNQIKISIDFLESLIRELKNKGIDGIEAYYPEYSEKTFSFCIRMSEKYCLLKSGGSDFHGKIRNNRLGYGCNNIPIPYSLVEEIKKQKNY